MTPRHSIPILNLQRFYDHPEDFVQELGAGYQAFGFCGITGHGIDTGIIDDAFTAAGDFFALPEPVKMRYHQTGQGGARGYTGFGIETAKDSQHPDLKEFWHMGRECDSPPHPALYRNLWPVEVPMFKPSLLAMYQALDDLGRTILSALALYLRQDKHHFDDKVNYGNSILRPIHYPPIADSDTPSVRAGAHEDINLITLLVGSEQPGLQIKTRAGEYIPVMTIPNTIVVNIGDMLQRYTNHVLPSTTHRVINPPGEAATVSRYSMPFFLHFNPDFEIRTLDSCVGEQQPDRYPEPLTANEYLQQRLEEIRLL